MDSELPEKHADFSDALRKARLSQAQFRRLVASLTGHHISAGTVSRWSTGSKHAPVTALALLRLVGRLPSVAIADLVELPQD